MFLIKSCLTKTCMHAMANNDETDPKEIIRPRIWQSINEL
jgi:hypothetical protein